jgi:hypothetical protein
LLRSFLLENYRNDYIIGLFANGTDSPVLLATSKVIKVKQPELPLQGRITLTGRPGEAVVQWTTGKTRGGYVKWGYQSGRYKHAVHAQDLTYTREDMCGACI